MQNNKTKLPIPNTECIARYLSEGKRVPPFYDGKFQDVCDCLHDLTIPLTEIDIGGLYVLPPIQIDKNFDDYELLIQTLSLQLLPIQFDRPLQLEIVLDCKDKHWRLLKIECDKGTLQSIVLWDTMPGHGVRGQVTEQIAEQLTQYAAPFLAHPLPVRVQFAKVNFNRYTTMDYVIREVFRDLRAYYGT